MTAKGWPNKGTFGIRVSKADARNYFEKTWDSVQIEIDGKFHRYPLRSTFWETCPEFRGGPLKDWLLRRQFAPWPKGKPPILELVPLGENRFRVLSSNAVP